MYSPRGRTGRTPGVKPIVAALAVALMGMGGVALAAPKDDPGAPEQAQGNGPAPQAQGNGPAPQAQANGQPAQAQDPAPPPQAKAKAKGHQGAGKPAEVPPAQPPQAGGDSNPGSAAGQGPGAGHHGRPAPGETRGQGRGYSSRGKSGGCHAAACRGDSPKPDAAASGGGEQPLPTGGQQAPAEGGLLGGSEERTDDDQAGTARGEREVAAAPESESVMGVNQGGGEEADAESGSFDGALPFTGLEVVLLAGIGALLALAGVRLRRSTA